jgi:hypothetical protein
VIKEPFTRPLCNGGVNLSISRSRCRLLSGAAADVELWSRVADEHVVMSLSEPLIYYRLHPSSMTVARFFEQRLIMRWIKARQDARRRGGQQASLKEYRESREERSTLRRLQHERRDWGTYLTARSALARWEGLYLRSMLMTGAGLALNPRRIASRAWANARQNHDVTIGAGSKARGFLG